MTFSTEHDFAFDRRVWRQVGDPLVDPAGPGPLDGESVAVKDVFAVAGHRIGAGNPAWLSHAEPELDHAAAVDTLLGAGAAIRGITRADEFGFGLSGANAHYGTAPNPRAPGRISGGSTSGAATAVASGHASIGLGTDTMGCLRVPAAYQGLWSIRTTHAAISTAGVLSLARRFDAVGWLARDAGLLAAVGQVLLPSSATPIGELLVSEQLTAIADGEVAEVVRGVTAGLARWEEGFDIRDEWLQAFATLVAYEAWREHGKWLLFRLHELSPFVRRRFERGASIDGPTAVEAAAIVSVARLEIARRLGDQVLVIPSVSSVAPLGDDPALAEAVRRSTVRLTCVAALAGLPAVNVPLETTDGLPTGLSLIGPSGSDHALLELATALA